jgi:hypothetical protein
VSQKTDKPAPKDSLHNNDLEKPGSPRNQAEQHGQSFEWAQFLPQFFASTFENWQSEFLQLVWQAAGLALALLGVLAVEGVR